MANTRAFGRPDYPYFRDWIISWLSTVAIRTSEEDPVHHFRLIRPDLKIWNAPSHPICILRRFQCLARLSLRRLPPPIQELLLSTDRVRCKLQYSRATRSDMKNICRFSIKITFFFPLARAFPPFLPPLRRTCAISNFSSSVLRRRGRSLRFPKIIIARIRS